MKRCAVDLNYEYPEHLITDQWGLKREFYIVYRWVSSIYFLAWLVASLAEFSPPKSKYLLNVTSWSFVLLNATSALRAILATKLLCKVTRVIRMTFALKLVWVLENVSAVMAIGVTVGYWSILNRDGKLPITAVTCHTHGVNGLYILIDFLLTARPSRYLHFWHSMTFAVIYLMFSVIYWALGGTGPQNQPYIYPALDWRQPTKTLLFSFLFGVVLTTITHTVLCLVTEFRRWMHKKYTNRVTKLKSSPEEAKEMQVVLSIPEPEELKEYQDVLFSIP